MNIPVEMFQSAVKCCRKFSCHHVKGSHVTKRSYLIRQWSQMGLHPALEQRLYDVNFEQPTQIQARVCKQFIDIQLFSSDTYCYCLNFKAWHSLLNKVANNAMK